LDTGSARFDIAPPPPARRRGISPITWRILAVNLAALAFLAISLLYLGAFRDGLIENELTSLKGQAMLFAAALGEGSVEPRTPTDETESQQRLLADPSRHIIRRMAETVGVRARLFDELGNLLADSRRLIGPAGEVTIEILDPPSAGAGPLQRLFAAFDRLAAALPGVGDLPPYRETAVQLARDHEEVVAALSGEPIGMVRATASGDLVLSVAVPVQRYKEVLGAVMLSKGSREIETALLDVRRALLELFGVVFAITVLLSIYLARTIARPIHRLAEAAEKVRIGHHRAYEIPDFRGRADEIGDLAQALRDMTEALHARIDAIERFAADVAHEIKNPLSSLRSAVETAARVQDADQQRRLMAIIMEDVQRLDRLISDISAASRLDGELARAETGPVDLGAMLETLANIERTAQSGGPTLKVERPSRPLTVEAVEGRLVQVLRNLIANAVSFSPPDGTIALIAERDGRFAEVRVEDEGPGLPPGKEEAIFERFYSERPASERFGLHSGLGLSISRQIVTAHGGTIRAENRTDPMGRVLGARLIVRLPLA